MKKVFWFDRITHKLNCKEVSDDYVLQANELPEQSDLVHNPSPTERLSMQQSQLALQQAQFQSSQQKLNSQLALQLATLTAKGA
ncbi:hypothetical protein [Limosilactobacillus fermentum]|uniref:hypothetical protein n=1 Tax=Limosilactobacillus fermentum TaxID=1613 RepID=UPI003DA326DA